MADTPGFSTFDIERYQLTDKEELPPRLSGVFPLSGAVPVHSCSHTCEKGCAILRAVEDGKIAKSRHKSYVAMYQEIKDVKQWQLKNKTV